MSRELTIQPLRNYVLVRPENGTKPPSKLVVVAPERVICPFRVLAIGPEVRDVQLGQIVLANRLTGTSIGNDFLLPESAIVGYL